MILRIFPSGGFSGYLAVAGNASVLPPLALFLFLEWDCLLHCRYLVDASIRGSNLPAKQFPNMRPEWSPPVPLLGYRHSRSRFAYPSVMLRARLLFISYTTHPPLKVEIFQESLLGMHLASMSKYNPDSVKDIAHVDPLMLKLSLFIQNTSTSSPSCRLQISALP